MCEPLNNKAIDVEDVRKTAKNRILRIGIELEGGWTQVPPKSEVVRDGSVRFSMNDIKNKRLLHIGEIQSPPLELDPNASTYWVKWLKVNYPVAVNSTCGMHVHMSFKTMLTYARLMDPAFPATIVASFRKWAEKSQLDESHPIWARLNGNSEFCQHIYDGELQVTKSRRDYDRHAPGHRYTVVNYAYSRHETAECRLLPMMETVQQAEDAIKNLLETTNAFLMKSAKDRIRMKATYGSSPDSGPQFETVIRL